MNTLHDRIVATAAAETTYVTIPPGRTSVIDRAAMRLGLWLLLWGRHRSERRVDPDVHARRLLAAHVRAEHDRIVAHATAIRPIQ
jgi:hypothetical protein